MSTKRPCQWEQFAKTAHPSFQQTQVQFCRCDLCNSARMAHEASRGIPTFRPALNIRKRFEALRWTKPEETPPEPLEETPLVIE